MCTTCTFGLKSRKQINFLTVVKYKSLFVLLAQLHNVSANYMQKSPQTRSSAGACFGHTEIIDSYIWVRTTTKTYKHDKIQQGLHKIVLKLKSRQFFLEFYLRVNLTFRQSKRRIPQDDMRIYRFWEKSK